MTQEQKLTERVAETIRDLSERRVRAKFSPALQEALRLSDLYEDIKPQEYVLPLDAMAGFCAYKR